MNKKQGVMLVLLATSLLISACKNVPPVTTGIGSDKLYPGQNYSQYLQLDNKQLATQLYISQIKSRRQHDLLAVNLSLTSRDEKSLALQFQFQWFDQDGFVLEPGKSPWQPITLHGKQTITVAGLAPSAQVATFSLYVRAVPEKFFKF